MSLCPSKRARGVILDDDDTDDAVAFEPGVNIAALVFSKIQCVRTRAALARASKFWLDVSKQKEALPRRFYLPSVHERLQILVHLQLRKMFAM